MQYTTENTLRVAKRYNNAKRTYLLVNPLQAKHIPVSPAASLAMMHTLGQRLVRLYPDTGLVIGFAETATAIGAAVSSCFPADCVYLHTTREALTDAAAVIRFQEEHSHAVDQMLYGGGLAERFDMGNTVLLVEDEISTGKTMINMVRQLKQQYPQLANKRIVAASILNRVSPQNEALMRENGIECVYLVKLPDVSYSAMVEEIEVHEAQPAAYVADAAWKTVEGIVLPDPRVGVQTGAYEKAMNELSETICSRFAAELNDAEAVLVLGTEECMYPALKLGYAMEQCHPQLRVRCHATTRSPIGITEAAGYPITCGCKLKSLYETERTTYLYDLDCYDLVFIVTDSAAPGQEAIGGLVTALSERGCENIYLVKGGSYVRNI